MRFLDGFYLHPVRTLKCNPLIPTARLSRHRGSSCMRAPHAGGHATASPMSDCANLVDCSSLPDPRCLAAMRMMRTDTVQVGLELLVDHSANDTSQWAVVGAYYGGQLFPNASALLDAWQHPVSSHLTRVQARPRSQHGAQLRCALSKPQ